MAAILVLIPHRSHSAKVAATGGRRQLQRGTPYDAAAREFNIKVGLVGHGVDVALCADFECVQTAKALENGRAAVTIKYGERSE